MSSKRTKGGYYAVKKGRNIGVFNTWNECEAQTKGFRDAKYKKFQTLSDAQRFLSDNPSSETMESVASSSTATVGTNNTKGKKRTFGREVEDVSSWDVVYSDGACKGNGKLGSIAGVGVWWGPNDPRNIAERCPGDQTNNRAELIAILRVLETTTISKKPLLIRTDSQYCINCFRSWIHNWRKNDWRNSLGGPVKNAGIIRCISLNLDIRSRLGQKVVLEYVKGHSGDTGNDGADLMANQGATLYSAAERDWESLEK
ncbi:ribonuclease H-like domain-containing protein, partial [Flammula alnicola]